MTRVNLATDQRLLLGIEGGGTRTTAILADLSGTLVKRIETGPANIKLVSDAELAERFAHIAREFPRPDAVAAGLAGARTEADLQRIRSMAERLWPGVPHCAANDLETGLAAAEGDGSECKARVLIISGTGSCCFGRNRAGKTAKIGGWGHILGDKGSGYEIGMRGLKAVVYYYDRDGVWPELGRRLLLRLLLNEPDDLVGWVQTAGKDEVAGLATEVFAAGNAGDKIATDILTGAAESLAKDATACAKRLAGARAKVQFVFAGGVLLGHKPLAERLAARLKELRPGTEISSLTREGAWGAVALARELLVEQSKVAGAPLTPTLSPSEGAREKKGAQDLMPAGISTPLQRFGARTPSQKSRTNPPALQRGEGEKNAALVEWVKQAPTEQRNPRSMNLDKLPISKAIELMLSEEATIPAAILAERAKIERAVRLIARAFKHGGRLFYVGAGTSGRLGVLDASECPPTFRTAPELVQGIMAGGQTALWRSVEGAEDDPEAGARAITFRKVGERDVVVGIAASGRTPFVWGALGEAGQRGAATILVAFNPFLKIPRDRRPDVVITPNAGPEVLTGSTRLKAGTATKLILNILTTLAMVQIGKVEENLMVDLNPSNEKLRDRAVRIVRELRGVDYETALRALENSGWVIKKACATLSTTPPARKRAGR